MATLLSTTVPDNGYYRVGTSTNTAYVSSGGIYAHFGNDSWYSSALGWQSSTGTTSSTNTGKPFLQLTNNSLGFYTTSFYFINPFSTSAGTTILGSTETKIITTGGNSNVNSTLGVGAAAGTGATDGKVRVNAGSTSKPFLEVTNCSGRGGSPPSVDTFPTFKGYLGIKIGANVGATAVTPGTYFIRLWNVT